MQDAVRAGVGEHSVARGVEAVLVLQDDVFCGTLSVISIAAAAAARARSSGNFLSATNFGGAEAVCEGKTAEASAYDDDLEGRLGRHAARVVVQRDGVETWGAAGDHGKRSRTKRAWSRGRYEIRVDHWHPCTVPREMRRAKLTCSASDPPGLRT